MNNRHSFGAKTTTNKVHHHGRRHRLRSTRLKAVLPTKSWRLVLCLFCRRSRRAENTRRVNPSRRRLVLARSRFRVAPAAPLSPLRRPPRAVIASSCGRTTLNRPPSQRQRRHWQSLRQCPLSLCTPPPLPPELVVGASFEPVSRYRTFPPKPRLQTCLVSWIQGEGVPCRKGALESSLSPLQPF